MIAGNYVGTNVAGSAALGNNRDAAGAEAGIELFAGGVTIGGTAPADRNLVSGNNAGFARGIELWDSSGNTIQGNYVGTNAAGTLPLGNAGAGIALDGTVGVGSDNNLIGGVVAGAGNLFSGGLAEGVAVYAGSTGNAVLGNRIYGNAGLGIDLNGDGVTANDALDGDGGPNNQLNFPVIRQRLRRRGVARRELLARRARGVVPRRVLQEPVGRRPFGQRRGRGLRRLPERHPRRGRITVLLGHDHRRRPATGSPPPRPCAPTAGSARRSRTLRSSART